MGNTKQTTNAILPATLEDALVVIASQGETVAQQKETIDSLNGIVKEQSELITKLESKNKLGNTKPTIVIGTKTYTIKGAVRHKGVILSPQAIAENADAAEEILKEKGQTILTVED